MNRVLSCFLALLVVITLASPCQDGPSSKDFLVAGFTIHVINNKDVPIEVIKVELIEDAKWPENISITIKNISKKNIYLLHSGAIFPASATFCDGLVLQGNWGDESLLSKWGDKVKPGTASIAPGQSQVLRLKAPKDVVVGNFNAGNTANYSVTLANFGDGSFWSLMSGYREVPQ